MTLHEIAFALAPFYRSLRNFHWKKTTPVLDSAAKTWTGYRVIIGLKCVSLTLEVAKGQRLKNVLR